MNGLRLFSFSFSDSIGMVIAGRGKSVGCRHGVPRERRHFPLVACLIFSLAIFSRVDKWLAAPPPQSVFGRREACHFFFFFFKHFFHSREKAKEETKQLREKKKVQDEQTKRPPAVRRNRGITNLSLASCICVGAVQEAFHCLSTRFSSLTQLKLLLFLTNVPGT